MKKVRSPYMWMLCFSMRVCRAYASMRLTPTGPRRTRATTPLTSVHAASGAPPTSTDALTLAMLAATSVCDLFINKTKTTIQAATKSGTEGNRGARQIDAFSLTAG